MIYEGLTIRIVLMISTLMAANTMMIRSDRVTNWGNWGSLDQCPSGSFVKGIDVKVESYQRKKDDTAMNAVHLSCVPLDYQVTSASMNVTKVLKSAEGGWGTLRGVEICHRGVAIGFQLRSEDWQNKGDDTAANDMRLICANSNGNYLTAAKGMTWGTWRSEKRCPPQMAICGLQTQVESWQRKGDDTALNNVDLLCCQLPNPAAECNPTDSWQQILYRDNRLGTTPIKYTIREKVGVQKSFEVSQQTSVTEEISLTVGFKMSASLFGVLGTTFETKLGTSTTTQHAWSKTETSVFTLETEETMEINIPANCVTTLYKIVGRCGGYVVNSNDIKRVDDCSGIMSKPAMTKTTYQTLGKQPLTVPNRNSLIKLNRPTNTNNFENLQSDKSMDIKPSSENIMKSMDIKPNSENIMKLMDSKPNYENIIKSIDLNLQGEPH